MINNKLDIEYKSKAFYFRMLASIFYYPQQNGMSKEFDQMPFGSMPNFNQVTPFIPPTFHYLCRYKKELLWHKKSNSEQTDGARSSRMILPLKMSLV